MFFDIVGLVSAEKRLINVVNLRKKGDHSLLFGSEENGFSFFRIAGEAVRLVRRYYRIFSSGRVRFTKVSRINLSKMSGGSEGYSLRLCELDHFRW